MMMASGGRHVKGSGVQGADEVVLYIHKSKTDPDGQGSVANVFETPGDPLCLISLLKAAHRMRPGHFANPENYLLVCDDGRVLSRDIVVESLRVAAVEEGVPAEAVSAISMRAGGASAMWHEGFTADEIKRRGRWGSECWRVYVWEGRERARGVAGRMLSSSFSLMAALANYSRA